MVTSKIQNGLGSIVLTPNRSASWRANRRIIYSLAAINLLIGGTWALLGAYMILPFAGIEVVLLAYFLHQVSRASHRQQVLTFGEERIDVELGIQFPSQSWSLLRDQSFFTVDQPAHPLDGPLISLCDKKQQIELSPFLNKEDREQLLKIVRSLDLRLKKTDPLIRIRA